MKFAQSLRSSASAKLTTTKQQIILQENHQNCLENWNIGISKVIDIYIYTNSSTSSFILYRL